jgi:putative ABC transport system ATP-binding protein
MTTEDLIPTIDLKDVTRLYKMGDETIYALRGVTMKIFPNEYVAIMGPSGSGKSTLMNMI